MKSTVVYFIIFFFLVCIDLSRVHGAEQNPGKDFLAAVFQDPALGLKDGEIEFLKSTRKKEIPWLREIEIRMTIDEFNRDHQSAAIRFKPELPGRSKQVAVIEDTTLKSHSALRDLTLHRLLRQRYDTLVEYFHVLDMIRIKKEMLVLLEDRVHVLENSSENLDFNISDLIEAEDQALKISLELIELKSRKKAISSEMQNLIPQSGHAPVEPVGLISIEKIEALIDDFDTTFHAENIYLQNCRLNADLTDARYQLERSENQWRLSFIETSYDVGDRDDFEKAFSIEFGISIPLSDADRVAINLKKLDGMKARSNCADEKRKMEQDTLRLKSDISGRIHQYKTLKKKDKQSHGRSSLDIYRQMEGVDPLILLKLRQSILHSHVVLQNLSFKIRQAYIELLDISGRLSNTPFINHLSETGERIIP